jgi:hypothetical protein
MKFDDLYNEVINEAGTINKIRSKNYDRLAQRSYNKATKAWDKAGKYEWDNTKREPHEKEFMKQMDKMSQREKKAKELKK